MSVFAALPVLSLSKDAPGHADGVIEPHPVLRSFLTVGTLAKSVSEGGSALSFPSWLLGTGYWVLNKKGASRQPPAAVRQAHGPELAEGEFHVPRSKLQVLARH